MHLSRKFTMFPLVILFLFCLSSKLYYCQEKVTKSQPSSNHDPYYSSFITARMKHLTAISDMKQLKNAVKQHQLVVDLSKKIFTVLEENRRLRANGGPINASDLPPNDETLRYIVDYVENTAFFCDLLVFFPEITAKLLEKNLLWRITLIDSIQEAMSMNATFVDKNTHLQFEKAFTILSEGAMVPEPKQEKKIKEIKKPKRGPRLTANEL